MSASNCEFINTILVDSPEYRKLQNRYRLKGQIGIALFSLTAWIVLLFAPHIVTSNETATGNFVLRVLSDYFIIMWLIYAFYRWFADGKKGYCIRQTEISYRHGLFCQSVISTPTRRIQHISIEQGFLDRIFNLSNLSIRSAGVGFTIPGVGSEQAEVIRQQLLSMIDGEDNA